jgi:hypothetical protein
MKRRAIALVILLLINSGLMLGCAGKAQTDPVKRMNDIKARAERLRAYSEGIISVLDELAAQPLVKQTPKIAVAIETARPAAVAFKDAVEPIASLVAALTLIDPTTGTQLKAGLEAARVALKAARPAIDEVAHAIGDLVGINDRIDEIGLYIGLALSGIDFALSIIESRLQ